MTKKAENDPQKINMAHDVSHISVDIFLISDDGKTPPDARKWLNLYVEKHIRKIRDSGSVKGHQLRLVHITDTRVYTPGIQDEFQEFADSRQYFGVLDRSETVQLQLHGLLAFLLFARESPAIIIADKRGLEKLGCHMGSNPLVQDLKDDAFIVFVTDGEGMKYAGQHGLHAVPWQDQSQEPVIERVFLFQKTREIKGFSRVTHEVRRKIIDYGRKPENRNTHHPVLIIGESRTGKELIANALYDVSGLNKGKFIAVACGTFTQSLLLSEIFGYWPGAFTSSDSHGGVGLIESAENGALLVDDIDAAKDPKGLQGAFLRCLITDPPSYRRVGARPMKKPLSETADTWLMFTLNKPVRDMIKSGKLREDFLFRFQRIIQSPPISARPKDIPQIAMSIWKNSRLEGRPLSIPVLRHLRFLKSNWEANAGELQSLISLACELLHENKLMTWIQAIDAVMKRGEDYLAWYENYPEEDGFRGAETYRTDMVPGNASGDTEKKSIISSEFPEKPHEVIELLKEEIRNKPNIRFETDVVKRVCNIESQEMIRESEVLERKKSYDGYRHWYSLGMSHRKDANNEAEMACLLEKVFSREQLSLLKNVVGSKKGAERTHCYKVLLFLALHPDNTMKRKEMSAILWDRKGNKPLTSFETHRKIFVRLLGSDIKANALKKHEMYENEHLIVDYSDMEWRIRLKTTSRFNTARKQKNS